MANILDSVIIDPDAALYSDRILGYNNNTATIPDNVESWMTDVWFPGLKTLSWNSQNYEFVNISPSSLSNWPTEFMFVGQFGIESNKHGWIYSLAFGGWIYVSTDPYSLYTNLYWEESLYLYVNNPPKYSRSSSYSVGDFVVYSNIIFRALQNQNVNAGYFPSQYPTYWKRIEPIVYTHINGVPSEPNLYADILMLEAATISLPGVWVWFQTIELDSSFASGWVFFSRASVGISSNQFNNTGVTGHVNGEGVMGWGIFLQTVQGSNSYWNGGVAFVAGSDGKIRYKSHAQSSYSLL